MPTAEVPPSTSSSSISWRRSSLLAEARGGKGVEVGDLTQEGTIAGVVAVLEYAGQGGPASGLDRFVSRLVASHMDDTIELAAIERASDEAFVRDTEIYEAAEIRARHEFGRTPTVLELAAELGWPEERVAIVGAMLNDAGPATTARSSNTSTTSTRSRSSSSTLTQRRRSSPRQSRSCSPSPVPRLIAV